LSIARISNILFPQPKPMKNRTTKSITHFVTNDVVDNLEGVIQDLVDMGGDKVCIKTLTKIQNQLIKVKNICEKDAIKNGSRD
jgi:hypothetical protein